MTIHLCHSKACVLYLTLWMESFWECFTTPHFVIVPSQKPLYMLKYNASSTNSFTSWAFKCKFYKFKIGIYKGIYNRGEECLELKISKVNPPKQYPIYVVHPYTCGSNHLLLKGKLLGDVGFPKELLLIYISCVSSHCNHM